MPTYKYLIIGGGMAAGAALPAIREVDADGSIGLIGAELHPPYQRPPLSKALWKGDPLQSIWIDTDKLGVKLHLGRRVQRLDLDNKRVTDDQGDETSFDKLLLATGSTPKRLSFDGPGLNSEKNNSDRVIYYRGLDDYERLRRLANHGSHFAVIGGGFIGSEIAAALTLNGMQASLIVQEPRICARIFPQDLGEYVNDYYRDKGVELLTETKLVDMQPHDEQVTLTLQAAEGGDVRELTVDGVVIGVGVQPNVDLAKAAGLEVQDGIVVDEMLRASHPDVYVAGDIAAFFDESVGERRRMEHEDTANSMGRVAGRNMAGAAEPYAYLPFFYSDLFDLGYEAVGKTNAKLQTVADWQEPFQKGVIYYLDAGRVRGVLLWNVFERLDAARELIGRRGPFQPADLKGHITG